MADANRTLVNKLVLHHAVTPTWEERSKPDIAQWFSDLGFARGYSNNAANWSGLINPYTGQRSYSMAHVAGQRVDGSTPDATDAERAAGFRIIELVQDIWGSITWNAGNWPVNCSDIGLENLGDYRNYPLRDGDCKVIADFWRPQDQSLGGATFTYGHDEVSQLGTQCPARIMESRDAIVNYINNPPQAPVVVPTPIPEQVVTPEPTAPQTSRYVRFTGAMSLTVNKSPTNVYNMQETTWESLSNNVVTTLPEGTEFIAVGKYLHPLGGVYFMTAYSFGNADTTGTPDHFNGINTVDLSPKIIDTPPVVDTPVVDNGAVNIPVTVIPVDPNKYKLSINTKGQGKYTALQSIIVKDYDGDKPDLQLVKAQEVNVYGQFTKDDITYWITNYSQSGGHWYGIPLVYDNMLTLSEDETAFDILLQETKDALSADNTALKNNAIKTVASIDGFIHRLLPHKN